MPLDSEGALVFSVFRPLDLGEFEFPEQVMKKLAAFDKKLFYRLKITSGETLGVKENGETLEISLPEKLVISLRWPEKLKQIGPSEVYILLD